MATDRLRGFFGIIFVSSVLFVGSTVPTLAAWFWCKTATNVCENHPTDDHGAPITEGSACISYCSGRGAGWRATNFDTTSWIDRSGSAVGDECPDVRTRALQPAPSTPSSAPATQTLYNPLGADATIPDLIGRIIKSITGVMGALALLAFTYGGIRWLTAYTDEGLKEAKSTLKHAIIGLIIIFFAYTLASILISLFAAPPDAPSTSTTPPAASTPPAV